MTKILSRLNVLVDPFAQSILICVTSLILFFLTLGPLYRFDNFDPAPKIISADKNKSGLEFVQTGFEIKNFLQFDILKNEFVAEGVLWFVFDPTKVSYDTIKKFSFSKGEFLRDEFLHEFSPEIKKLSDDKQIVQYNIRIKFSSNLNYKMFPLDSHRLYLTLNNKYIDGNALSFQADKSNFIVSDTLYTPGWLKINSAVKYGYTRNASFNREVNNPRIIYSIDFIGVSIRNIMLIFLPLFVMFFLSLILLSLDVSKYKEVVIPLSGASIPAILGYRFVIETISPKVSYFILADHIFNLFLLLSVLVFLIDTFFFQKFKGFGGLIILGFHIILISSWTYLLYA